MNNQLENLREWRAGRPPIKPLVKEPESEVLYPQINNEPDYKYDIETMLCSSPYFLNNVAGDWNEFRTNSRPGKFSAITERKKKLPARLKRIDGEAVLKEPYNDGSHIFNYTQF